MLIYSLATLGTKFSKLLLKFHGVLYNERLHSSIGYMTPDEVYSGILDAA
ncbi:hypothetical protein [Francisella halioticida]|nr:hypothetical protein [Francisella halioticida]